MRIIAGEAKGRSIAAPKGRNTRPTLDRVKESLFGIIQFEVPGSLVLDLFAGSGNLGLEALSRGASYAVFNDKDGNCARIVSDNVRLLRLEHKARILNLDWSAAVELLHRQGDIFDIAFLDPPYATGLAQEAAQALFERGLMAERGIVIAEHNPKLPIQDKPGLFKIADARRYGDVAISILERDC